MKLIGTKRREGEEAMHLGEKYCQLWFSLAGGDHIGFHVYIIAHLFLHGDRQKQDQVGSDELDHLAASHCSTNTFEAL